MLEKLMTNPVAWAVLAVCTAIGVPSFLFTVWSWFAGKRKKEISWARTSNRIVTSKISSFERLTILYDGNEIEDLSITKFAVWNSGLESVKKSDFFSEEKQIMVRHDDSIRIWNISVVEDSDTHDRFEIDADNEEIGFVALNSHEGSVIQVIHSGFGEGIAIDADIIGGRLKNIALDLGGFRHNRGNNLTEICS